MKKIISLAVISALISTGCTSLPVTGERGSSLPNKPEAISKASTVWGYEEPLRIEGKPTTVVYNLPSVPERILNKKITNLKLSSDSTLSDLAAALTIEYGINVVFEDGTKSDTKISIPFFKGTVRDLLSLVSKSTNYFVYWDGSNVVFSKTTELGISIPQNKTFAEHLTKQVAAWNLGGVSGSGDKKTVVDHASGFMRLNVTPATLKSAIELVTRLSENAVVINVNFAVFSIRLSHTDANGIDMSTLAAALGSAKTAGEDGAMSTLGASLNKGSITFSALNSAFSVSAVLNVLKTFGNTETSQDGTLSTISDVPVSLVSKTSTPYVSKVTATSSNNGVVVGSSETAYADDGITVKITPLYNASTNVVQISIKLTIDSVLGLVDVSAGNQLGTQTLPQTAKREFESIVEVNPGVPALVGGLKYETLEKTVSGIKPNTTKELAFGGDNLKINKNQMYILVKPTVIRLGASLQNKDPRQLSFLGLNPSDSRKKIEPVKSEDGAVDAKSKPSSGSKKNADTSGKKQSSAAQ